MNSNSCNIVTHAHLICDAKKLISDRLRNTPKNSDLLLHIVLSSRQIIYFEKKAHLSDSDESRLEDFLNAKDPTQFTVKDLNDILNKPKTFKFILKHKDLLPQELQLIVAELQTEHKFIFHKIETLELSQNTKNSQ